MNTSMMDHLIESEEKLAAERRKRTAKNRPTLADVFGERFAKRITEAVTVTELPAVTPELLATALDVPVAAAAALLRPKWPRTWFASAGVELPKDVEHRTPTAKEIVSVLRRMRDDGRVPEEA